MANQRLPFRLAVVSFVACGGALLLLAFESLRAQSVPASTPASVPAEKYGRWSRNSTQPPPEFVPTKLPPLTTQPGDGPAEGVTRAAIAWFDWAIEQVDKMAPAAELAADKIIAGGNIFVTGHPGFMEEMELRAGSFPFLSMWDGHKLTANDVLLIGQFDHRERGARFGRVSTLLTGGRPAQALSILVASGNDPTYQRLVPMLKDKPAGTFVFIDSGAPDGSDWPQVSAQQMATTAMAFAFQGEMFAAATRKGKVLATYSSNSEPVNQEWDTMVAPLRLHADMTLDPIPAGKIGKQYLRTCQKLLAEWLIAGRCDQVRQGARRLADTMAEGHCVLVTVSGHIHSQGAVIPPEFTRMVMFGRSWQWHPPEGLRAGDTLLELGCFKPDLKQVERVLAAGANAVVLATGELPTTPRQMVIDSHIPDWDSVVNVDKYPLRLLPCSGVLQTPQWYALMAETQKAFRAAATQPAK